MRLENTLMARMLESVLTNSSPKGEEGSKGLQPEVPAGNRWEQNWLSPISRQLSLPCRSSLEFSLLLQVVQDVAGEALGTSVPCEPHLPVMHHGAFLTPDVL